MPIHRTKDSMKFESIIEMIKVAEYCINFEKLETWGYRGCYGYPATLLLLAIVDGIGSHINGGSYDTKLNFQILNNPDWYNLGISPDDTEVLRSGYRNKLSHELHIRQNLMVSKGNFTDKVLDNRNGEYNLNLVPFFEISKYCVEKLVRNNLKLEILI